MTGHSKAPPLFEDAVSADAVLQSSDGIRFYVSKAMLAGASPFLRDLFSLEQLSTNAPPNTAQLCIIHLDEDSESIESFLRIIYNCSNTEEKDLSSIGRMLETARKYQIRGAEEVALNCMLPHADIQPLETYAFACRFNIEEVAADAAVFCKDRYNRKFPRPDSTFAASVEGACYVSEMSDISTGQYFRLLQFVRAPIETVDTRPSSFCKPRHTSGYHNAQKHVEQPKREVPAQVIPETYTQPTDLALQSTDQCELRVHCLVIELAGGRMLINEAVETAADGLPMARVGAPGWVLAKVVQLCYPCGAPGIFQDLPAAREILRVAVRYDMSPIIALAQAELAQLVPTAPLRIYFIAAEHDWLALAEHAARTLATAHLEDVYVPEMEDVSARAYFRLLRYYHECRTTICRVASRHSDYVQGWRAVSKRTQTNLAALAVPLPIVEMWTQKMLSAQEQPHTDGHIVGLRGGRGLGRRHTHGVGSLVGPDLQVDYVDAAYAMDMEIKEELLKVQPKLDEI
ncbi:uncharacterized protein PHACADRAFT_149285 [Phanerochaete carnosa HHB-10118-sp]|uniref:BTB domain-containing protein n=1 Tax=Phanerochaete carnosa (strain HHB-10118-sp) TaxID=650164 RepID=K5W0C0_PHACS|nr:uncharacterized protein PHACADRAFT_149285 [Phanerochaete carnosa HHB-10118-sp]EKM52545.1 hypothetical protein PHACADRAFT_149285 [Phanerochaete carnosa HHB-10118-sp]